MRPCSVSVLVTSIRLDNWSTWTRYHGKDTESLDWTLCSRDPLPGEDVRIEESVVVGVWVCVVM